MTIPTTGGRKVYLLPGWQNSGPSHWQSRWEALQGWTRLDQSDWWTPRRGDWMARLDATLSDDAQAGLGPAVLVAHSLGCHLVAAWAAHTRSPERAAAALLVAPPDLDRPDTPAALQGWRPMQRRPLPFPATVVASRDDPYAGWARSQALAADWGATLIDAGPAGHLNGESGLGDWSDGLTHLAALLGRACASSGDPAAGRAGG